jgi:hypothetical protein
VKRPSLAFLAALLLAALPVDSSQEQRLVFRARADLVVVDVSVFAGDTPVGGLTATDFQLSDNGVPQRIELVSTDAVPADVSLVVDTSASVVNDTRRFWEEVRRISGMLRPGDRLGVTTFATQIRQVLPMAPVPIEVTSGPISAVGHSAVFDALVQAMLRPGVPDRRRLIVAFTDGLDNRSVSDPARLVEVAVRSDGLLNIVLTAGRAQRVLSDAAHATGGEVLRSTGGVAEMSQKVLDRLQRSYLLQYVPEGVPRSGWHELRVTVAKPGTFTVRARRGYFGG